MSDIPEYFEDCSPEDYAHIAAWGELMGSFDYYVAAMQELAAVEGAPKDALYKRAPEQQSKYDRHHWVRVDDIRDPHGEQRLREICHRRGLRAPKREEDEEAGLRPGPEYQLVWFDNDGVRTKRWMRPVLRGEG